MAENSPPLDRKLMTRALELARRGRGLVEPNPLVGCVVAREGKIVGEGWHARFGGPHAEVEALAAAGEQARGATAYVSLEPCCYHGKTGPCTEALIQAGISRVVVGCQDPNPRVAGKGILALRQAGIHVQESIEEPLAQALIAPFEKLTTTGRPWIIAKWAMTLDGKIATSTGSSQWISGEASRARVHELRGLVDGVMVGRGTVEADDPLLTARPAGPRIASRIVLDKLATLSSDSQLVQSVAQAPLLVAVAPEAPEAEVRRLEQQQVEVIGCPGESRRERLGSLLDELGRRQMTHVLVEGGAGVLGTLLDIQAIDEVLVFIAPKLVGGHDAPAAIGGLGIAEMANALKLEQTQIETLDGDVLVSGRVGR